MSDWKRKIWEQQLVDKKTMLIISIQWFDFFLDRKLIMNTKKQYKCKYLGCRRIFDWPTQLARHSKQDCHPQPVEEKKYFQKDRVYICCKCNKECTHQPNIIRHVKKCNGNRKEKRVYDCHKCSRTFSFKCWLTAHLKNHLEVCNVCHKKIRIADLFNQHRLTCVDSSDEQFTPSFVTDNSESFDQVVPSNEKDLVNDYELNFENQSPMSQGLLNDIGDNPILNEANESNNDSQHFKQNSILEKW